MNFGVCGGDSWQVAYESVGSKIAEKGSAERI